MSASATTSFSSSTRPKRPKRTWPPGTTRPRCSPKPAARAARDERSLPSSSLTRISVSSTRTHPTNRGSWRPNPVRNPRGRKKYFFVLLYMQVYFLSFTNADAPSSLLLLRRSNTAPRGAGSGYLGNCAQFEFPSVHVHLTSSKRFQSGRTKTFRARHRVRRPPEARSSIRRALAGSLAEVDATSILDERDSIRRRRRRRRHGRPPRDGSRNARWDAAHRNAGESTLAENARRGGRSGDYTPSWDSGARSWTHSRVTRVPPVRIAGDVVRGGGFQVSARARSRLFAR